MIFSQLLKKDHVEFKRILGQLIETKETKKREELFHILRIALVPHMKSEESTFYYTLTYEERGS